MAAQREDNFTAVSISQAESMVGSGDEKFQFLVNKLKNNVETTRLQETVKDQLTEQKRLVIRFNAAAITFITMNTKADDNELLRLLNMDEDSTRAPTSYPPKKRKTKKTSKSVAVTQESKYTKCN